MFSSILERSTSKIWRIQWTFIKEFSYMLLLLDSSMLEKITVSFHMRLLMLGKSKLSFDVGSITLKVNIKLSGKEIEKYPRNCFIIIIV